MLGLLFRIGGLLLAGAAATAAVAAIVIAVNANITAGTIREQAKMKCPSAVKAVLLSIHVTNNVGLFNYITEVKTKPSPELKAKLARSRKVDVGLFDRSGTKISEMTIESSEGVSENLYVGQEIYI